MSKGASRSGGKSDSFDGMKPFRHKYKWGWVAPMYVYELMIWIVYVCLYKWAVFAESRSLPRLRTNFPFPQLMLYAIATTIYVIPLYRWLGPWLLRKRKYMLVFLTIPVYFFFWRWCNWGVSYLFKVLHGNPAMDLFYDRQFEWYEHNVFSVAIRGSDQLVDIVIFFSVMFVRWAFENEWKRRDLERDHLVLQLETLKAQLHPHFLFNTLNSIYGMSLTGARETPAFILRLSDMMRYVLYDCQGNQVSLDKDLAFVGNYLEMEKKRYPSADISFEIVAPDKEKVLIAPLLLIPFLENSFKHGSQRVTDDGFIRGRVEAADGVLHFSLSNSVLPGVPGLPARYGGVGVDNVRKRLALYYPERHTLQITGNDDVYTVDLKIRL